MSPHVTTETAAVYRCVVAKRKTYLTRHAVYYAVAKEMVLAKYPPENNGSSEEYYEKHPDRRDRLDSLFIHHGVEYHDGYAPEEYDRFDPDKWQAFVRRLARFLRFVDETSS